MTSPNLLQSPYRLPPIPKSASGNDLVSGIVDKFNSLTVVDKDEQKDFYEKQILKLRSALDRAEVAREEAETQAKKLRDKLLDLQDERQKEKSALKERASEFEKKYEKAKDRFKMQRAKHADEMHKASKDHMENDKRLWRTVALAQEETEWERQLRTEAQELLDFVEMERYFEAVAQKQSLQARSNGVKRFSPGPEQDITSISFQTAQEEDTPVEVEAETETSERTTAEAEANVDMHESEVASETEDRNAQHADDVAVEEHDMISVQAVQTPKRQILKIPVHFNDGDSQTEGEDKENQTPAPTIQDVLKTPMTMDRAAALAAIEYRRGRAKSFLAAQTPQKLDMADRRDVSAPPLITMTVGRRK